MGSIQTLLLKIFVQMIRDLGHFLSKTSLATAMAVTALGQPA